MPNVNEELQRKVVSISGKATQVTICCEEPSELIQAITKLERRMIKGEETLEERIHLAEEMCDVYIILERLKHIYKIDNETIQKWINAKEKRQEMIMEGIIR